MRLLSALFLIILLTALGVLAYQNNRETTIRVWDRQWDVSLPLLVLVVYVLGMLSGWSVLGMLRRSWRRATEPDRARA
jgi:lipopolysaccharide assembly protein A